MLHGRIIVLWSSQINIGRQSFEIYCIYYGYKFKILDFDLPTLIKGVIFEANSPFRNKFTKIYNSISEFYFDKKWESESKQLILTDAKFDENDI